MSPVVLLFTLALACALYINAIATRRLLRCDALARSQKALLVMGVWAVPLVGAWLAFKQAPSPLPSSSSSPPSAPQPARTADEAPRLIELDGAEAFDVRAHLQADTGFPMLDWQALDAWASGCALDESRHTEVIQTGRRAWLLHLRDRLGAGMHLHENGDALILSSLEDGVVRAIAGYISRTRLRIARVLDGMAHFPAGEKSVLLVLQSEELYYEYVAQFYPDEGEFAFSGGMFIGSGCPHFVVAHADLAAIEPVIAHELTHSALSHLQLPLWLDEGLAVNTEHRIAGTHRAAQEPQAMHQRHMRFWNAERVQEFWSGDSFHRTDEGTQLSYDLARIAVEQMARDWPAFGRFVAEACRDDAGAEAARSALGIELGTFIAALVQPQDTDGDWSPRPQAWSTWNADEVAAAAA